jgi:hypothetical protein
MVGLGETVFDAVLTANAIEFVQPIAITIASSSADSTVERGVFGPITASCIHRLDRTSFSWRTYWITSSARARMLSGTVSPIAFAALRLTTSSYFVGACTAAGGLISYGPNYRDEFRRAAGCVNRILKGERPADLPV